MPASNRPPVHPAFATEMVQHSQLLCCRTVPQQTSPLNSPKTFSASSRGAAEIVALEAKVKKFGLPGDAANLRLLKAAGFSDLRLASLTGKSEADIAALRRGHGVRPVYKRIDTCAAEFASPTAYM